MTVTIDEKELARVAKQRRFDARTLEIAHRLIIGKEPPLLLAAEYGVIHQRIYAIRRAVLKDALPVGMAEITLRGPVEAIEAARRAFDRHLEKHQGACA
ncbi:hypothetical protein [uncultured Variovorax sp.]|jgi:hypothetical protein|uniref:hypothetical protein n=1 Tax=uncultured Variovorax sp. TaxID=114708 RepID=UPI0026237075|nr:hypothetical protein [uncultured Variovorax sp.]